jgi:hypothetical protein
MFADYSKAAAILRPSGVSLKSTSSSASKSGSKSPDASNDTTPVDDECYDGSVVGGTIVWKSCTA